MGSLTEDQFDQFVHECGNRLRRVAMLMMPEDRGDVDDSVQDVLIGLYRNRQKVPNSKDAYWYCYKSLKRRTERQRRVSFLRRESSLNDQTPDPGYLARYNILDPSLIAAVKLLRALDRDIIILRYAVDMSSAEVGTLLGLSPETVRGRARNALKEIRTNLGEHMTVNIEGTSK